MILQDQSKQLRMAWSKIKKYEADLQNKDNAIKEYKAGLSEKEKTIRDLLQKSLKVQPNMPSAAISTRTKTTTSVRGGGKTTRVKQPAVSNRTSVRKQITRRAAVKTPPGFESDSSEEPPAKVIAKKPATTARQPLSKSSKSTPSSSSKGKRKRSSDDSPGGNSGLRRQLDKSFDTPESSDNSSPSKRARRRAQARDVKSLDSLAGPTGTPSEKDPKWI